MKIVYVCADPGIPVFGCKGCSLHVQEMLRAFLKTGAEVTLLAASVGGEKPADFQAVQLISMPERDSSRTTTGRAYREQQAIHSKHWFLWKLYQLTETDLIYERYSLWGGAGVRYAQELNIPSILEVNAPLIEEARQYRGLVHEYQAASIARQNFQGACLISCVSKEVADYVQQFCGQDLATQVIPNAVDPARFSRAPQKRIEASNEFVIGFVGTLKPWHGLEYLLRALPLLLQRQPGINASLLIVGDGTQREACEVLADELGVRDRLRFTGAVKPARVPQLLQAMDVAVAPYPELENFYFSPLKVYEYMAAGLPVVASDIGQISELIQHGENGLLVKPGNAEALAQALERISTDPAQASAMAQQARQDILQQHSWDAIAEKLLKWAEPIIARHADRSTDVKLAV